MIKQVCFILLFSVVALAHDVDRNQTPFPHLGLDDPEFFQCHFDYWHCRRELNEQIRQYSECVGQARALHSILRLGPVPILEEFLNYWDVIPAHPIEDAPGDVPHCKAHIVACEATFQPNYLAACRAYVAFRKWWHFGVTD